MFGPYKASELMMQFDEANRVFAQMSNVDAQTLLEVYGLYKQSTSGDIPGFYNLVSLNFPANHPQPSQPKEKAKMDAWKALKGTAKQDAMVKYVQLINYLKLKRSKL